MSYFDYDWSRTILKDDPPFNALIMAAMRKADTYNSHLLRDCWPDVWDELKARYHAPGGCIEGDQP